MSVLRIAQRTLCTTLGRHDLDDLPAKQAAINHDDAGSERHPPAPAGRV